MSDKIAKILVVEDDENVRRPVCAWLEIAGYAVTEAGDGDDRHAQEMTPRCAN